MAQSKTAIIKEYLSANPDATGKEAEQALKKHGINAQYFSQIKSNLTRKKKPAQGKRKKSAKTKVKRKVRRTTAPAPTLEELQSVAEFANDFGGLDKLTSAVDALRRFQMKAT